MKIFSFIFIFYLLFLSWQPCQDLAENASLFSVNTYQHTQTDDGERSSEQTDDCSPLCICSCCQVCSTGVFISFNVESQFTALFQKALKTDYQSKYSQHHLDSIWQPPRFDFTA